MAKCSTVSPGERTGKSLLEQVIQICMILLSLRHVFCYRAANTEQPKYETWLRERETGSFVYSKVEPTQ